MIGAPVKNGFKRTFFCDCTSLPVTDYPTLSASCISHVSRSSMPSAVKTPTDYQSTNWLQTVSSISNTTLLFQHVLDALIRTVSRPNTSETNNNVTAPTRVDKLNSKRLVFCVVPKCHTIVSCPSKGWAPALLYLELDNKSKEDKDRVLCINVLH